MKIIVFEKLSSSFKTGLFFVFLSGVAVDGNLLINHFNKIETPAGVENGNIAFTSSKIKCAEMCNNDESCASFAYKRDTKSCEMSDVVIAGPGKTIYFKKGKKVCPEHYTLLRYPDMKLCLLYENTQVQDRDDAIAKCSPDGGHLTWIDSNATRQHIYEYLSSLGVDKGDLLYFDGFDKDKNKKYWNWRGEEMIWTAWGSGEPTTGDTNQQCLFGRLSEGYKFTDETCNHQRNHFICQFDV